MPSKALVIKFAQKSIATKPTIVDMIKAYTVLKKKKKKEEGLRSRTASG